MRSVCSCDQTVQFVGGFVIYSRFVVGGLVIFFAICVWNRVLCVEQSELIYLFIQFYW